MPRENLIPSPIPATPQRMSSLLSLISDGAGVRLEPLDSWAHKHKGATLAELMMNPDTEIQPLRSKHYETNTKHIPSSGRWTEKYTPPAHVPPELKNVLTQVCNYSFLLKLSEQVENMSRKLLESRQELLIMVRATTKGGHFTKDLSSLATARYDAMWVQKAAYDVLRQDAILSGCLHNELNQTHELLLRLYKKHSNFHHLNEMMINALPETVETSKPPGSLSSHSSSSTSSASPPLSLSPPSDSLPKTFAAAVSSSTSYSPPPPLTVSIPGFNPTTSPPPPPPLASPRDYPTLSTSTSSNSARKRVCPDLRVVVSNTRPSSPPPLSPASTVGGMEIDLDTDLEDALFDDANDIPLPPGTD